MGHAAARACGSRKCISPTLPKLIRARGGLGIGLSLVRRLVELHGGTVHASSDGVDRGGTFTVQLPLATGPMAATATRSAAMCKPPGLKVLVVDDNEDVAAGLAALLPFNEHEIRVASEGRSALALTAQFVPDLAFCDIGMQSARNLGRLVRGHTVPAAPLSDEIMYLRIRMGRITVGA